MDNLIKLESNGYQLYQINSFISQLRIRFVQSSSNIPTGYHEDIYNAPKDCRILPLTVTWKDNIHRNDYLAFDYESDGQYIKVAYNASTGSMSYLLVYIIFPIIY